MAVVIDQAPAILSQFRDQIDSVGDYVTTALRRKEALRIVLYVDKEGHVCEPQVTARIPTKGRANDV